METSIIYSGLKNVIKSQAQSKINTEITEVTIKAINWKFNWKNFFTKGQTDYFRQPHYTSQNFSTTSDWERRIAHLSSTQVLYHRDFVT